MIGRVVEIAGTPVRIVGEGRMHKGWTITPAQYKLPCGETLDMVLVEKGERKTLCSTVELARRWIARRGSDCPSEKQ